LFNRLWKGAIISFATSSLRQRNEQESRRQEYQIFSNLRGKGCGEQRNHGNSSLEVAEATSRIDAKLDKMALGNAKKLDPSLLGLAVAATFDLANKGENSILGFLLISWWRSTHEQVHGRVTHDPHKEGYQEENLRKIQAALDSKEVKATLLNCQAICWC
jgi:hypothetical protein